MGGDGAGGDAQALLLNGVYGTGKSSIAAELADLLEDRGVPYAAIDLDWLEWYDVGEEREHDDPTMMLTNLAPMLDTYLAVGVRRFVLARAMRSVDELRAVLAARGIGLRVVRLTVPLDEIARRMGADVTAGRADDLRMAGEWLAARAGEGSEDLVVANEGSIGEVARSILVGLGWG